MPEKLFCICDNSLIADAHDDYGPLNALLTFETNEKEICVSVKIQDDLALEQVELFLVTLERTPDLDDRVILNNTQEIITIFDDDREFNTTQVI